jgi:hypothetical protein
MILKYRDKERCQVFEETLTDMIDLMLEACERTCEGIRDDHSHERNFSDPHDQARDFKQRIDKANDVLRKTYEDVGKLGKYSYIILTLNLDTVDTENNQDLQKAKKIVGKVHRLKMATEKIFAYNPFFDDFITTNINTGDLNFDKNWKPKLKQFMESFMRMLHFLNQHYLDCCGTSETSNLHQDFYKNVKGISLAEQDTLTYQMSEMIIKDQNLRKQMLLQHKVKVLSEDTDVTEREDGLKLYKDILKPDEGA